MRVMLSDFIQSPALYLNEVLNSTITIVDRERPVAILTKPENTPISDNLVELLKNESKMEVLTSPATPDTLKKFTGTNDLKRIKVANFKMYEREELYDR